MAEGISQATEAMADGGRHSLEIRGSSREVGLDRVGLPDQSQSQPSQPSSATRLISEIDRGVHTEPVGLGRERSQDALYTPPIGEV